MSDKQYTVSSNLTLLYGLANAKPVAPYSQMSDVELCGLVKIEEHRGSVRSELLRRHAAIIASQVVRQFSRGMGGSDIGDYESLGVITALGCYDDYDSSKNALPSSIVFATVLRRLIDAQRRTSIETDCRWPIRKLHFRHWLNGDYDAYPEYRERFEHENGVTPDDRNELRLMHSHLLSSSSGVWIQRASLDIKSHSVIPDHSNASADVIIDSLMLQEALDSLKDDRDRQVIHLFAFEDLSTIEISRTLKMPLPEVRTRIRRAKLHLTNALT